MRKVHDIATVRAQSECVDPDDCDAMLARVSQLQRVLIERDGVIHALNDAMMRRQQQDLQKRGLKKLFTVISAANVDTATTASALADACNLMLYTLREHFGGAVGMHVLDIPYNRDLGATAATARHPKTMKAFWSSPSETAPAALMASVEDLALYQDIVTHQQGKAYGAWEVAQVQAAAAPCDVPLHELMVLPVVVDGGTIAVLVFVNAPGGYPEHAPGMLGEILPELWTSNVSPLINQAVESQRKSRMESALLQESTVRDEIILSLDTLLDGIVQEAIKAPKAAAQAAAEPDALWQRILQGVADYFEKYFNGDVLLGVTNTPANFRITRAPRGGGPAPGVRAEPLEFVHYVFSKSLDVNRTAGTMRHLAHPKLGNTPLFQRVMAEGAPFHCNQASALPLPCHHMKLTSALIVPLVFCDEPVGLLGVANGDFDAAAGRVLQSVFTTFWSMIVKASLLSQSQKVLNSALPAEISVRLKGKEAVADSYESATVCFVDICGFGAFTKPLASDATVAYLNTVFARVEALAEQHGLEKIKLMGDCCIIAGGVKDKRADAHRPKTRFAPLVQSQVREMCAMALDVQREAMLISADPAAYCLPAAVGRLLACAPLQFRIGIATGPLTAGVFGREKMQYDVLGATVNLASRLKTHAPPGATLCSERVRELLAPTNSYQFTPRQATLKGFGPATTYLLEAAGGGAVSHGDVCIDFAAQAAEVPLPALKNRQSLPPTARG